jgi:hypothetical protein
LQQLRTVRFVCVVGTKRRSATTHDCRHDSRKSAQRRVDFADVVQQRSTSYRKWRTRGHGIKASKHNERVSLVCSVELIEKRGFGGRQNCANTQTFVRAQWPCANAGCKSLYEMPEVLHARQPFLLFSQSTWV